MSSSNKTTNLGLNQWVLTDPFLMEDMNADNKKIDAAVGANPFVKLLSDITQSNASQVDLSLSGIDLTQYAMLRIEACCGCTPANSLPYIYVRINNIAVASYYQYGDYNAYTYMFQGYASYATTIPACFTAEISGISGAQNTLAAVKNILGSLSYYGYMNDTHKLGTCPRCTVSIPKATTISSINVTTGDAAKYIQAGSEFTVYGVRK